MQSNKKQHLILVVDDSPDTLGMLNDVLNKAGMASLVALEGEQAIHIAKQTQPDIILMDAIMPKMDGFESCRIIKSMRETAEIPVIFMTGLSDTESIIAGFEVGGADYLTKPINPVELIARMKVHLSNARTTRSVQQALDVTGQTVFAMSSTQEILWSTPNVNVFLETLDDADLETFKTQVKQWFAKSPNNGDKCRIKLKRTQENKNLIYMGGVSVDEHFLRLVSENEFDELKALANDLATTPRESEVLLWIARGKTNQEIGQIIGMSPRTVNKHLEQIYRKLEVDNRTCAAVKALGALQKVR